MPAARLETQTETAPANMSGLFPSLENFAKVSGDSWCETDTLLIQELGNSRDSRGTLHRR